MKNSTPKQRVGKFIYFIGMSDIDWSNNRWENKGGYGFAPKKRKGYIGLWDRNICKFRWFKIVKKSVKAYGYIVERNSPYPINAYWSDTLKNNYKYL